MPMPSDKRSRKDLIAEIEELRRRLLEAEELLQTIPQGDVDALPEEGQQCALKGNEPFYRALDESMKEGAATLTPDGTSEARIREAEMQARIAAERERAALLLSASETRYRTLFENMLNGFAYCKMLFDERGRPADFVYLEVNSAFGRLTGLENVIGKKVTDIIPGIKESDPELLEIYGRVALTGQAEKFEIEVKTLGIWFSISVFSPDRGCFVAVFENITERKQAESALRDSERLYRAIGESIDYGIWVCTPDGRNTYVSDSFLKLVGLTQEQCSNFGWGDVLHPDDAENTILAWQECTRIEGVWDIEHRFLGTDGQWHPVLARGVPVRNERGEVILWAGINLDISRMKQAEEALRDSEHKFSILFNKASLPAVLTRLPNHEFADVNDAWGKLSGYAKEECLGKTSFELGINRDPERRKHTIDEVLQHGQALDLEQTLYSKSGEALTVLTNVTLLSIGGQDYALTSLHDITERKRVDQVLRSSEERQRLFIEHAPAALAMFDRQMVYLSASRRWQSDYGLEGRDLIGVSHYHAFPEISREWKELHRRGLAGEVLRAEADRFERADGSVQWVRWEIRPWYSSAREVGGIVIFSEDISYQKQAEDRIHRQSEILAGINTIFKAGLAAHTEDELGETCLSVAEKITGSRFGFIGEIGPDGLLHDIALSNPSWDLCSMYDPTGARRPPGNFHIHGIYGRVCKDGKSFFTNDPASHPDSIGTPPGHPPLSAFLGVPLVHAGETIGMIAVGSREGGYGQAEMEALEALAPALVEAFQHRRAAKSLKESEERFRTMANAMPQLAWIAQPNGSVSWYNQRWYDYTGTSPEQMAGWEWQSVHDPLLLPKVLERWQTAIATGEPAEMEFPLLGADGRFRRFLTLVLPLKDSQGNVVQWLGTSTDITEITEAEQALHRYELLADNSRDIILFIGREDGLILEANVAACEAYGYAKSELLRRTIYDIRMSEERELVTAQLAEADARGILFESVHRRKDGSTFPVEVSSRGAALGGTRMLLSVVRDITERKQAEEQLRQSEEKYRLLCHHQEEMLEKERMIISRSIHDDIGQGLTALDLDLGWVTHKISPLQTDQELDGLIKEMHCRIDMLIAKVQNITAELRAPLLDNLGLKAAIEWQMREFRRRSGIEFDLSVDDDYASLSDDICNVIIRTLQESLTNIIRHSQATEVTVSLGSYGRYVVLDISDNGRGVTEEELSSSTSFGIMGMKERAESCQGKFLLSGVPNGGTTAILELPLSSGDANEPDSAR